MNSTNKLKKFQPTPLNIKPPKKLREQLQFIICTWDGTLAFVHLDKKSHSYTQFPNCGMDFLWNKRRLLRSSFYSDNSADIDFSFSKTRMHFSIYCVHKLVPWVEFIRKYIQHKIRTAGAGHLLQYKIKAPALWYPKWSRHLSPTGNDSSAVKTSLSWKVV